MTVTTEHFYTGNNSTTSYAYTFPYYKTSDIKVALDNVIKTESTHYNVSGTNIVFTSGNTPGTGVEVHIYRETDVDTSKATFAAGSSIRATDLNNNNTQLLYAAQEEQGQGIDTTKFNDGVVTSAKIADNAITTAKIAADAVTGAKIADDAIDSEHLAADSIDAEHYAAGSVDATALATNAVTTVKITDANVTEAKIASNAITGAKIADDQINSEHYVDGSIDTAHIADSQITAAKLASDAVTTAKITDANITTAKIANDAVTADKLAHTAVTAGSYTTADITVDAQGRITAAASGSVGTSEIANDAITSAKIADDSIDSEHYVDASIDTAHIGDAQITTAKIANSNITTAKIANDAVDSDKIATNAVGSSEISTGAVTDAKLASDAVTTVKILDSNVTTAKIAADAITGAKIADDAIDSEHYTDGSIDTAHIADSQVTTAKIADDAITAAKVADDIINSEHYAAASIDTEHIADGQVTAVKVASNAVTTSKITDANVTTDKIADDAITIGKIGCEQTTISDSDSHVPTSGAVVDYVSTQLAAVGGFETIATDAAFPNTQVGSGIIVSIADAGGLVVNGSGTSTTGRTVGGSTVTINNINSQFNSTTVADGVAFMVESTGSGQIYNYHKATLKEADLINLSSDIDDFGNRYRVNAGEPSDSLHEGDLVYDTTADKMKVYDSSTSAWKEVTSTGDFKYLVMTNPGTTNAATLNGSNVSFDLKETSTSGSAASVTSAAQLLVSVNGVVQKANTGTSTSGLDGFVLTDADTIKFCAGIPSGADVFIVQFGSALTITTPGDGTVSAAKIASGAVTTAKIADANVTTAKLASDAVTGAKIADDAIDSEHYTNGSIDTAHIADNQVTSAKIANGTITNDNVNASAAIAVSKISGAMPLAGGTFTGDVTFDNQSNAGRDVRWDESVDSLEFDDNTKATFGADGDLQIYHDGTDSAIKNTTGNLLIGDTTGNTILQGKWGEDSLVCKPDGAVELYYDNNKKFETISDGAKVSGNYHLNRNTHIGTVASGQSAISINSSGGSQIGFYQQSTNDDELRFYTHKAGVSHAERGRMDPDGYFLWGCTTQDSNNSVGIRLTNTGTIHANRDQEYALVLRRSSNDGGILLFRRDSTDVGNISVTSSATSYNTGSDYRLKQDDEPISDGITRLKQLKPIKFKWKNDTSKFVDGFFAHEVSSVVPESITGEKDAVYAEDDETGHKKGDPIYQQIDQAKLVPLLTAALQEAITEIETLKTKVAALEAK